MLPNNHRRVPKASKKTRKWEHPTLYQPSIYSYTCRGAFYASSDDRASEGTCRGLRSRLHLLSDMDRSTREGALKGFTYMTDYELAEEGDANSLNQKTKSILVSPALIYKDEQELSKSGKASQLPEEELIKRQSWSCYGSTEVELLVLKDDSTGHEHVCAVAPRNVGVSVRKIEAEEGSSITSIGIGWLNIVVDAGPSFLEDEEEQAEEEDNHARGVGNSSSSSRPDNTKKDPHSKQESFHQRDHPIEEVPPRPSPASLGRGKEALTKFYDFSCKVAHHMKINASWLVENVQDDFPSRSYAAAQKIAYNVPKTVDRTAAFMSKMVTKWRDGIDDDDDDDGHDL